MKTISNTKLIKRNKKIGSITTLVALAILGIGLYVSFTAPEQVTITFGALLLGFLMTQIGIYFGNRWGRSPRPDELLSQALKGLDDKYSLYHYTTGTSHALVGPAGIIALVTIPVGGKISFDENKGRFKQKGGNFYMKIFGQESIGRPELEAQYAVDDLRKYFRKNFPDQQIADATPILVFTNAKADLEIVESPYHVVAVDKLKDYIRRQAKENPTAPAEYQQVQKLLPQPEEEE